MQVVSSAMLLALVLFGKGSTCDILLTAACLGSGGIQHSFQQGPPRELQHHCAATGLLTLLSVYTLSIAAGRI